MNTRAERKNDIILLFCLIFLVMAGCNYQKYNGNDSIGISVVVNNVISNYPIEKTDTIEPIPEVVFILTFKNESEKNYHLIFQNYMSDSSVESTLKVKIQCSNGALATIPLFQNTNKSSILNKKSEMVLSFKAKSLDIQNQLKNCGHGYLGKVLERETEFITILYKNEYLTFEKKCKRQGFKSPEYFLIE